MSAWSPEQSDDPAPPQIAFTEAAGAMVAAVLHLVRLLGAELVLVRGYDIGHLEPAVHAKLNEFTSPTANQQAREAGLVQARHLVGQVLTQIRAQVELKKSLTVANLSAPLSSNLHPIPFPSKLSLADAAAERRRWDFLLTAAPLPIRGGTGSPANPIATF